MSWEAVGDFLEKRDDFAVDHARERSLFAFDPVVGPTSSAER